MFSMFLQSVKANYNIFFLFKDVLASFHDQKLREPNLKYLNVAFDAPHLLDRNFELLLILASPML